MADGVRGVSRGNYRIIHTPGQSRDQFTIIRVYDRGSSRKGQRIVVANAEELFDLEKLIQAMGDRFEQWEKENRG